MACALYQLVRSQRLCHQPPFRLNCLEHPFWAVLQIGEWSGADALGLTAVHLNRALQRLRNDGLITLADGFLGIPSWPDLERAGGFDPGYLHLAAPVRASSGF